MLILSAVSPDGGIGRRAGLKHQWSNPCRFDPGSGYQTVEKCNLLHGFVLPSGAVSGEFVGFFRADLLTL